jgi:hypothetical protein
MEGGVPPLVVKAMVGNGMKRKEIKGFLLERNGIAFGARRESAAWGSGRAGAWQTRERIACQYG